MHGLIAFYTRASLPGQLAIHSGCATFHHKNFLVTGEKWAGKTTLLCKLLYNGFDVHGDEYVILKDSNIIPYPRKFRIKEETLNLLPDIRSICKNLRGYTFNGSTFYLFDPLDAGFKWEIAPQKTSTIFYLEPNHGKESKIEQIPTWQIIEKVIHQIDNFSIKPNQQIKDLCRFIHNANCYVLYLGDLDQATQIIKESLH